MPLLPPAFDLGIFESCSSSKGVSVAVVDANAIVHGDKLASRSRLPPEALPLVLQSTPRRQQRHSSPPTPAVHRAPFARRRRTPLTPLSRDAVAAPVAAGHRRRPWTPLPPIEESSLLRFNTCRAKGGASGFKVAILGAAGGIGQPLALLMKMNTGAVHYGVDIGRKKKQQPAAAATKKEGEAEETTRESRKTKEDYYSAMRWKKDEEREAQECLMEEEAMARKAKEEEAAAQDFEKWKGEFSVDAEGTTENDIQDGGQDLLSNFVEYIKE